MGQGVTSRSHDDLLSRGNFIVIWSLRIYLNSFSFYTNCYREWILNRLTYFWCFLERFIEKFILNIINEHAQDYSCPGATFAFCSHGEKLPWKGGLPGVVQRVTRLSKLPRGNEKLIWTVTGVRPCTEAKLTPGSVSCPGAMSCPWIMWTGPKCTNYTKVIQFQHGYNSLILLKLTNLKFFFILKGNSSCRNGITSMVSV